MSNKEIFSVPIRVYYEDTDAGGLVYHANYLKFMERARTEWLRNLGIEQQSLLEQSIGFVVIDLTMKNSKAAVFNDMLSISCQVVELKKASMLFKQHAYRVKDVANTHKNNNKNAMSTERELLVSAEVRVACVDLVKMKPIAIPDFILREIKRDV
nr:tol-pal system-associated acyl-CoA thioesterase [uncultured Glaciecola sp.]